MIMMRVTLILTAVVTLVALVQGHGYLSNPPQRNSAWRAGFNTPTDHNDMSNYCGGRGVQHNQNGGKCGVCGEEFKNPNKRIEPGPANKYATGTIFATYEQGQTVDVTVQITAFHKGYFEFRLCENDVPQQGKDASVAVAQECLDQNLLQSPSGETKFPASMGKSTHKVVLAPDVYCTACVIQWRYRTGNNWGCEGGNCGSGLGPQEEFVGCSDIAITPWGEAVVTKAKADPTPTTPTSTKPPTSMKTEATKTTEESTTQESTGETTTGETITGETTTGETITGETTTEELTTEGTTTAMLKTSETTEKTTPIPTSPTQVPTTKKPTPTSTKSAPKTKASTTMKVIPTKKATPRPMRVITTQKATPRPTRPRVTRPRVTRPKPRGRRECRGRAPWAGYQFDVWCNNNCNHYPPHCPRSHCACNY